MTSNEFHYDKEELESLIYHLSSGQEDRSRCDLAILEKITVVLKDEFNLNQQLSHHGSSSMSVDERDKIRKIVFNKLPFRELQSLVGSLANHVIVQNLPNRISTTRLPLKSRNTERRKKEGGTNERTFVRNGGRRILLTDYYPYKSIQLGCFYISVSTSQNGNGIESKQNNCVCISRPSNSLLYRVACQYEGKRYLSTYLVPFSLINGIYANDHDVFIRLDSSALSESCFCDGKAVDFDATHGERSNSFFHHIVLRTPAHYFCERLLTLNKSYFTKILQPFSQFSKDLTGVSTPTELQQEAKSVVARNSRVVPLNARKVFESRAMVRRAPPNILRNSCMGRRNVQKGASGRVDDVCGINVVSNEQTVPSAYSLQQIVDTESVREMPVVRPPCYYSDSIGNTAFPSPCSATYQNCSQPSASGNKHYTVVSTTIV